MRFLPPIVLVLMIPGLSPGQDSITPKVMAEVKASTVFVQAKNKVVMGSGSGFVFRVEGGSVYIATNHHVINLPTTQKKGAKADATVTVVFGSGTPEEETKPAEVVDSDPSRDLAILKVEAPKKVPKPIAMLPTRDMVETMSVVIFGFPFGSAMSTGKKGPAITVNKGSVSSIRRNDFNQVVAVQIDGALNPGNSGGPVVDTQGRLVGIAVASIDGAHIGLAIPAEELTRMLDGRVGGTETKIKASDQSGKINIDVVAQLIDPLGRLKAVSVHYVIPVGPSPKPSPNADGHWQPMTDATKVDLKVNGHQATGSFDIPSADGSKATVTWQISYVDGFGQLRYTAPTTKKINLAGSTDVAESRPSTKAKERPVEPKGGMAANTPKKDSTAKGAESKGGFKQKETEPKATNAELGFEARSVGDIKVTDLKVNAAQAPRSIRWSADGKSFYVLEKDGLLRRIQGGDLVELMQVELGKSCTWVSESAEGLVLTMGDTKEVWVVDPATFQVKTKVEVASLTRAVSSPALSIAFAAGDQRGGSGNLTVIDLKVGKVVREYTKGDFDGKVGFTHLEATPDGKYLFSQGGIEQLQRYKVKGTEVTFEESSERIASNGKAVEISPDGFYVALPAGGGNGGGPYTTNVYKITNLTKPEIVIKAGAYPQALGFDIKNGLILGQNHDFPLILFQPSGAKIKEYTLSKKRNGKESARQFIVHPDGGKCLVLTDASLYYVELPEK